MATTAKSHNNPESPVASAAGHFVSEPREAAEVRAGRWLHFAGLLALTLGAAALCYFMIEPFLASVTSAIALAVAMVPMQRFLEKRRWRPWLAALFTVFATILIIALPMVLIGERLIAEVIDTAAAIESYIRTGAWQNFLSTHPYLERATRWVMARTDLPAMATSFSGWATAAATSLLQASGSQIVSTVITFYMLFFALRDRRLALTFLTRFSPLSPFEMTALNTEIAETIRATLLGTVLVALIQGVLGGTMFWLLGLPAPVLWGLVMGLAAIVPVLGTFIIWVPAAIFLFLTGSEWQALVLVIWGVVVIATIDNLLYPILVGNRLHTHTIPMFISLVGGLLVFGPAGIIIGPVIFTTTIFLLDHWRSAPPLIPQAGES